MLINGAESNCVVNINYQLYYQLFSIYQIYLLPILCEVKIYSIKSSLVENRYYWNLINKYYVNVITTLKVPLGEYSCHEYFAIPLIILYFYHFYYNGWAQSYTQFRLISTIEIRDRKINFLFIYQKLFECDFHRI